MQMDAEGAWSLAVVGATLADAQRAASEYVAADLTWKHRNSIYDFQDYLVASHDGDEFHVYGVDVEQYASPEPQVASRSV
jgi:hypothetical protein